MNTQFKLEDIIENIENSKGIQITKTIMSSDDKKVQMVAKSIVFGKSEYHSINYECFQNNKLVQSNTFLSDAINFMNS